jgi:hypothetical protein
MLHVVDLHYVSICGGRWCPFGHTLPTVKDTHTSKERNLHNAGAPYPRAGLGSLRFSHFTTGKPGPDMAFNGHNGEGLYIPSSWCCFSSCSGRPIHVLLRNNTFFRNPQNLEKIKATAAQAIHNAKHTFKHASWRVNKNSTDLNRTSIEENIGILK